MKTAVTTLISGVIGSLLTTLVFAYQADRQAAGWNRQNEIEYKTRAISEKTEISRNLRQLIVKYYNFDRQTSIEANMRIARVALQLAYPGKYTEMLRDLPEIPSGDQNREQREMFSSMMALAVPVRIHFGDEIADKLDKSLYILRNYPNNLPDVVEYAKLLKGLEVGGQPDTVRIYAELKRTVNRPSLPEGLFSEVISDMVESVRQDIKERQATQGPR